MIRVRIRVLAILLTIFAAPACPVVRAQNDAGPNATLWFNLHDPKINDLSKTAVDALSNGLGDILEGLAKARGTKMAIDPGAAERAVSELKNSVDDFGRLESYVEFRKVDPATIEKLGYSAAFYDLNSSLNSLGYSTLTDGKSLIDTIQKVTRHLADDVRNIQSMSIGKAPSNKLNDLLFDIIVQKILLEKIGALSGVITTAMQ